ncbi:sensor histidine kinase [Saccharopolyspora montiporae]|uniref:sensor histidine kinase n=1 Tax=Saccharopolyspora montiporae TaxID=2781240 RepID=UPI00351C96CC
MPHTPTTSNDDRPTAGVILRLLRIALHTGFVLLLAIATTRVFLTHSAGPASLLALTGSALLAAAYLTGATTGRTQHNRTAAMTWLAIVTALWAALLVTSPDYSWVAFPLFFLHLHLLRGWHAITAVAAITGLVITTQTLHTGFATGTTIGPLIGAASAIVIARGYQAIYHESRRRQELIDDLTRTRSELATTQHQAGVAAERERLAREIHDTLAQGLSSIILLLRAADTALPPDADKARSRITEAERTATDNLSEARRFVRDLRPPSLTENSLPQALERLCRHTEHDTGIHCHLRIDEGTTALPATYEIALLRAAQATLSNVTRHARATTAVITLGLLDTEVTLDIYDDGTGFDPDTTRPRDDGSGYGLLALHERITALGGRMTIESTPGHGTAVAIGLPLTGQDT